MSADTGRMVVAGRSDVSTAIVLGRCTVLAFRVQLGVRTPRPAYGRPVSRQVQDGYTMATYGELGPGHGRRLPDRADPRMVRRLIRRSCAVMEAVEPGQTTHESGDRNEAQRADRIVRWHRAGDVDDGYIPVTRGILEEIRSLSARCRRPSAGRKPVGERVAATGWSTGSGRRVTSAFWTSPAQLPVCGERTPS
jgi:hypothetical protein